MKPWAGVPCIRTIKIGTDTIDVPTFKCLEAVYARILQISIALALFALMVMLVIGGFKFLTSGGDPKATASAKQTMTYAVAGLFLMVIAFLIFRLIEVYTGVTITVFEIPQAP
ncbi:MAG: hypothetical protein UV73_C0004G0073 [Candidatus Gottesmanbacteria bacterium GW2011_GWA2_43_14]|uniref:Uncharacterized protein n=1 Tax=Candidatus Gottesmanbacteria bacterium GW2011_GWA2_43_14 TaxID=1618443 RepID=A0A0G1FSD3_9BACT|nr:MAG: hypothetical protein UV73_C0004G0073 [Candidatus Gottesmanbacteria bacterium GW2011_GWA2_43_14]